MNTKKMVKKITTGKVNLNSQSGFTLVEVTVVMAIMAVLVSLMAVGLMTAGKQTRLRDAAKTLQSDIRKAANNSITVTPDLNNPNQPAKAWVIEIINGGGSYYIADFYGGSNPIKSNPSEKVTPGGGITFTSGSDLSLVFSSPFAKFRAISGFITSGSWTEDPDTKELTPPGTELSGIIEIIVKDAEDNSMKVKVNSKTGESSIE